MRRVKKHALAAFILAIFAFAVWAEQPVYTSPYPQIDISGFKKWERKEVGVEPSRNYFTGKTQLGGFYPTFSGGPWQERLQLKIFGQLSEDLSVTYDLDQQPETPERFDVKVKYYNNELTFGDINANFTGNEFVSANKFLNGVMLTAKDSWYDILTVPSAKLKSQSQPLTSQKGNNTRGPYNLGHGSIVEGSEQVQLNGVYLRRNTDYTIDYFEGKLTFNRILNTTDEFKYSYEFTNVLDLFFPALSKRDFLGFQSRFTIDPDQFGKPAPKAEPVVIGARDIFPSGGSVEPEALEGESSGQYQLRRAPVINFSETLTFMGTRLKKNDDYIIRYDSGEIKLLTRFLPSSEEALVVEYNYFETSKESEALAGIGSRGPYHVSHGNLVPGSERIEVDGRLFVRDLDYKIAYHNGEVMFGLVIGPTSQIKASYSYNVMALPPAAQTKFPKELKLGATYMRESAKQSAAAPTATIVDSFTGQTLIAGNYVLTLKNRPILPSSEAALVVTLRQGGVTRQLTFEVDYTVPTVEADAAGNYNVIPPAPLSYVTDHADPSDGYDTGTLYFYNQSINSTDEINVAYTYQKNIVGKYADVGNGNRGPYFLRNIRQIVPGSETVQVWDQGSSSIVTYTRNPGFDATAGETGYSLNYDPNNPSITFNNPLATTKNFQVIYQYVPVTAATGGNIAQAAYGFDGSFKIGNIFKIDSAYARSETDQVYVAETSVETFAGSGAKLYALHSPAALIEGSEKILVNNQLVNRDIDYFITYTAPGSFNFFYISPTTLDTISVEYKFQSSSGLSASTETKVDTAFRLGAETRLFGDALTVSGQTKKIGFDFSPLGGTAIGLGSNYEEYNVGYKPEYHSFSANYAYKFNQNPIGATRRTFLRSYDNSLAAGINPGGLARIDFGFRSFSTLDDPLTPGALHTSDNLQTSYSGSVVPVDWRRGALTLSQKYEYRKTTSKNHVVNVDDPNRSTQNIDYYHAGSNLKLTDRLGLGFDFQYNEPITLGSLETKTAHTRAVDNAYNLSLDLTPGFLQKLTTRVAILNHTDYKIVPEAKAVDTKNETYHMDVTPFAMLTGSLDHNRQERTAYVAGGTNPLSLRTSGTTRLAPFAWLSTGLNASKSENVPETGADNKSDGRTIGWDADYTPLTLSFLRLNSRFAASDQRQSAPAGAQTVTTKTNTLSQTYTLNLTLIPLLPLTFSYNQEDYKNSNNSTTAPVTTETSNNTVTGSTALTLPFLPQLTLSADYTRKITMDKRADVSRPKTLVNGKASYKVFSWGTLIYDLADEKNKGEVQAGAVADLDYQKTTTTIGLNIVIPVDNPVLINFTVIASLKTVDYKNNKNNSDDFRASLFSFEGTMNF
jgi:hypothetical protein